MSGARIRTTTEELEEMEKLEQEINDNKREDLFAATPPLEAKKLLFSLAMTAGVAYELGNRKRGYKLDFIDVRRAYFHAKARRLVYVQLPSEDEEDGRGGTKTEGGGEEEALRYRNL